jgi:hypothetical protein
MPNPRTKVKRGSRYTKKVTFEDVWASLDRLEKLHEESKKESEEMKRAMKETHEETEKAIKETQRIVGDIGNRFGDFSEATLVPDLREQFRKYHFNFTRLNEHVKLNDGELNIHTEIDAFLENGVEAIAVEVKSALKKPDVDYHIARMEKLRKYADSRGDKRKFYGAMAATVIDDDTRLYTLQQGLFLIEPSGESVKIAEPISPAKAW